MKLINSSVEIIPQSEGLDGIYKQIEIAGRTSYKSEDRITEDSAKKFVDMLISRGHTAPLEHGTIYLIARIGTPLSDPNYIEVFDLIQRYKKNPYSRVVDHVSADGYTWYYITTNARVIYENDWQEDLQYISLPSIHHIKRITVRFICSRSISHELVRHRVFSFMQESQRYIGYNKGKFGSEITYIIPYWLNYNQGDEDKIYLGSDIADDPLKLNFLHALDHCEAAYMTLIDSGCKPQEAREVLPNATKTEVVMTGFEDDWNGFFKLRCDKAAHPDMQKLANELKEKLWLTI